MDRTDVLQTLEETQNRLLDELDSLNERIEAALASSRPTSASEAAAE